jgi:hypothetical protein
MTGDSDSLRFAPPQGSLTVLEISVGNRSLTVAARHQSRRFRKVYRAGPRGAPR